MRTLAEIVRLRTAACREAEDAVAMLATGEPGVDRRGGDHVASCLRCQAEVVAYRRVLRIMRAMRADVLPVPTGALSASIEVLHGPAGVSSDSGTSRVAGALRDSGAADGDDPTGVPPWAVRAAYVGGITAASAAGVLVWFNRRRPGLLHAS